MCLRSPANAGEVPPQFHNCGAYLQLSRAYPEESTTSRSEFSFFSASSNNEESLLMTGNNAFQNFFKYKAQ